MNNFILSFILIASVTSNANPFQLNETQKKCLESHLGQPQPGKAMKSHQEITEAFKSCGVKLPELPSQGAMNLDQEFKFLTAEYKSTDDSDKKRFLRERIKSIYFKTDSETLKNQVKVFLKEEKPELLQSPNPSNGNR